MTDASGVGFLRRLLEVVQLLLDAGLLAPLPHRRLLQAVILQLKSSNAVQKGLHPANDLMAWRKGSRGNGYCDACGGSGSGRGVCITSPLPHLVFAMPLIPSLEKASDRGAGVLVQKIVQDPLKDILELGPARADLDVGAAQQSVREGVVAGRGARKPFQAC